MFDPALVSRQSGLKFTSALSFSSAAAPTCLLCFSLTSRRPNSRPLSVVLPHLAPSTRFAGVARLGITGPDFPTQARFTSKIIPYSLAPLCGNITRPLSRQIGPSYCKLFFFVGIALVFWATRCSTPLLRCDPSLKRAPFVVKNICGASAPPILSPDNVSLISGAAPLSAFLVPLSADLVSRLPLLPSPRRRGVSDSRCDWFRSRVSILSRGRRAHIFLSRRSHHFSRVLWHSNDLEIPFVPSASFYGCASLLSGRSSHFLLHILRSLFSRMLA